MKIILITILLFSFLSMHTANTQPAQGWYPQNSGTTNDLKCFSRSLSGPMFVVGNNGTILRTTNNGVNWSIISSGTNNHLYAAVSYSTTTGIITGSSGTILKTTDLGLTWFVLNSGTNENLYSVASFGGSRLTAVGDNGIIIRSTNGGVNWTSVSSPTANHLRSVVSAGSGWAVGYNGTILITTDLGINWNSSPSPTSNNLNAIIYNSGIFWIAGNNGTILKSTNNGLNWLTLNSGTSANLTSVSTINSSVGWVCGSNGIVLRTYNGGSNWIQRSTGTIRNLNSVFFLDINTGWAIGDLGTLLHTNTDSYAGSAKKLDANNISTWFRNNGSFNYNPYNQNEPGFEWPKGTGLFARFASGMWLGARVGNDTLVAIAQYAFEYLPGYTDNNGIPQGQNDPYYVVYKLSYGVSDPDRQFWPNVLLGNSNQGAPVYFDNQTNSWKPLDFGHQTLFFRYTDSYPEAHTVSNGSTAPLKADIMKLDFSVDLTGGLGDAAFSQFTVINRSTQTWNNTYFTFWTDDDLGMATDDKVGCDSARNLGYTYNGTNNDPVYGNAPPAVGFLMLRGALFYTGNNSDTVYICRNKSRLTLTGYKDLKMNSFIWYRSGADCYSDPRSARESYRLMSGLNRCAQAWIHPNGYVTKYVYSGDPVTGQGWVQPDMNDQRFIMSTGPVNMNPGDTQVIVIAQVIARGTSNLNSITALRQLTEVANNYYNTCYTSPPIGIEPTSNQVPMRFQLYQNYPNPFNPKTKIKFDNPPSPISERGGRGGFIQLKVYDVLGREVETLVNKKLKPGTYEVEFDGTNYPSGAYFYQLTAGAFTETKKMVLVK